jgi:hypothetical protein
MDAAASLDLPTDRMLDYVAACWQAMDAVSEFASDELLDALQAEIDCLADTAAVRCLPTAD